MHEKHFVDTGAEKKTQADLNPELLKIWAENMLAFSIQEVYRPGQPNLDFQKIKGRNYLDLLTKPLADVLHS